MFVFAELQFFVACVCDLKYEVMRLVGMCNFFVGCCGLILRIARRRAVCLRNASLASALGIPSATVIFFCVGTLNTLVLRVLRTGEVRLAG